MKQTLAHDNHNPDLLSLIPKQSSYLIEVGCSNGALAREYKKINHKAYYVGIDIEKSYLDKAKEYCNEVICLNIDDASIEFYNKYKNCDCWIFSDALEHTKNPWEILKKIRSVISNSGSVIACIPNAQHWSIQAKLSIGDFRYENIGLLDKTHLRWFTRQTINEMFTNSGFEVVEVLSRVFNEPQKDEFLPIIRQLALKAGAKEHQLNSNINDAIPNQYVIRAKANVSNVRNETKSATAKYETYFKRVKPGFLKVIFQKIKRNFIVITIAAVFIFILGLVAGLLII